MEPVQSLLKTNGELPGRARAAIAICRVIGIPSLTFPFSHPHGTLPKQEAGRYFSPLKSGD
jgi:hypothetical protein